MRRPLLGCEQGHDRRDRIDRKALAGRQGQHLAAKLKKISVARAAIGLRPRRHNCLDAQVPKLETILFDRIAHADAVAGSFPSAGLQPNPI
jgi:hypothetical protein